MLSATVRSLATVQRSLRETSQVPCDPWDEVSSPGTEYTPCHKGEPQPLVSGDWPPSLLDAFVSANDMFLITFNGLQSVKCKTSLGYMTGLDSGVVTPGTWPGNVNVSQPVQPWFYHLWQLMQVTRHRSRSDMWIFQRHLQWLNSGVRVAIPSKRFHCELKKISYFTCKMYNQFGITGEKN